MHLVLAMLTSLILAGPAHADSDQFECDRSGDSKVTALDAFIALRDAVDTCRRGYSCDSDGDYTETATDALLLLRFAVGRPVALQCSCIEYDQCFGDSDCGEGYPPGYFCADYLCVRCEFDTDCDEGQVCNACTFECDPAAP